MFDDALVSIQVYSIKNNPNYMNQQYHLIYLKECVQLYARWNWSFILRNLK